MSALELVCRLILPGRGRRGCRRKPTPLGVWPMAKFEPLPDLIPFTPDYDTKPLERTR